MATVFQDQLALAELMGNSFAPIAQYGAARVALAERDLARAQAAQNRAAELATQEAAAVRQDARISRRMEADDKRAEDARIRTEQRALETQRKLEQEALLAEAQDFGIQDVSAATAPADLRMKIQEGKAKRWQQAAQEVQRLGKELDSISSVSDQEKNAYGIQLLFQEPEVAAILSKYPDIEIALSSGQATVSDAMRELSKTRDAKEAQRAFSLAMPRVQSAVTDYIVARTSESRNNPRARALGEQLQAATKVMDAYGKDIHNPDLLDRYRPRAASANADLSSGTVAEAGLPVAPRTRPATNPAASQESGTPDEFLRLPSPVRLGERIYEGLPSASAPGDLVRDYLGSVPIALGIDSFAPTAQTIQERQARDVEQAARDEQAMFNALNAYGYLQSPYGAFSPAQAAQPITQEQINAAIAARRARNQPPPATAPPSAAPAYRPFYFPTYLP